MSDDKKLKKVEEDKFLIANLGQASWKLFGIYYPVFISSVVYAGKVGHTNV